MPLTPHLVEVVKLGRGARTDGCNLHPSMYRERMSRVIQIRDVPDDVHDALVAAAEAQGLSLTRYTLRELEHIAKRAQTVRYNASVIRDTQAKVHGGVDRTSILHALHEDRGS